MRLRFVEQRSADCAPHKERRHRNVLRLNELCKHKKCDKTTPAKQQVAQRSAGKCGSSVALPRVLHEAGISNGLDEGLGKTHPTDIHSLSAQSPKPSDEPHADAAEVNGQHLTIDVLDQLTPAEREI